MYAPIKKGRKRLRDTMLEGLAVQKSWFAGMSPDDPRYAAAQERLARQEALIPSVPKARLLRRPVDGRPVVPLEKEVIAGVAALLNVHPRILWCIRINSGSSAYTNAVGKDIPLWFFRWIKRPDKSRMSDFLGATVDCRIIAVECKRPGWTKPADQREEEQAAFLKIVRDAGGIGIFATNAQQVADSLA